MSTGAGSLLSLALAFLVLFAAACAGKRTGRVNGPPDLPTGNAFTLLSSPRLASYRQAEVQERRFSTEITLTNRDDIIKIEVIPNLDRAGAQQLTDEGMMNIEALYANALSPYPGDISNTIVSDSRYRPQRLRANRDGIPLDYFLLYANQRLGYGAATADTVKYRALLGWIYCEQAGRLYKVRCFMPLMTPPEEMKALFLSLVCPRS